MLFLKKRAKVVVPISKDNPSHPGAKQSAVYLLSGTSVQVWSVTSEVQQCEIDCKNVDDSVKRLFSEYVWVSFIFRYFYVSGSQFSNTSEIRRSNFFDVR